MFKQLEDGFAVSPQITAADVAEAASLGYSLIVCNRPDGEEAGQPPAGEIEDAAKAAGLSFLHLPVSPPGPEPSDVDATAAAMASPGKTLAYCRSGTRSATLWALARARQGHDADTIVEAARAAGYDLSGLRDALVQAG